MPLFFIQGASGTGKTTLMHELLRRGEEAHDTDTQCNRVSKLTNKTLNYEEAKKEGGYNWIYPKDALYKLKELASGKNVYLLGSIDNFNEVKDVADEYIWMSIPLDELNRRLDSRQKEYGKSASERKLILDLHKEMSEVIEPNTFILDSTKPVETIADDLIAHVASLVKR